jgi:hypothetical protein
MSTPTVPDPFATIAPRLDSPAATFYAVTPSDSANLPTRPRALRVGVAGDVTVSGADGVAVLFKNCYAGEILDIRPLAVKANGTTAQNIVALL